MRNIRVIPRLDIKYPNLIKGVRLEGLRVMGDPAKFASEYYLGGADELLYMDVVASLYERNTIGELIEHSAKDIFIPLSVGGGIRTVDDARQVLRQGADKVVVNTAAVKRPEFINELVEIFGSQSVVVSIEAQKKQSGSWEVYHDNGREATGRDVLYWLEEVQGRGCGEIIVTAIDNEGTLKGFDVELMQRVTRNTSVPVIASGGLGKLEQLDRLFSETTVNAVAIAHLLHYKKETLSTIKNYIRELGYEVRI